MPFGAVGAKSFVVEDAAQAREQAQAILKENFAVVLVHEGLAEVLAPIFESVEEQPTPCIVALPFIEESTGRAVQQLRTALRSDMETQIKHEADTTLRQQLIDEIIGANSVEAPRPMVQRMLAGIAQNYQIPDDQLEKFTTEMTPMAEQQVKRNMVIDHVAETEKLTATEEDLDAKVEEIAKARNVAPGQVYASLQKAKQLPEMERGITEQKVFDFLMAQSNITDETV